MTEREAWTEGYAAGSLDMDNGIDWHYDERHAKNPYPPRWPASASIGIEGPTDRPKETTMGNPTAYYEDHTKREFATRLPKGVTPLPMEMSLSDHMAYFNAQHTLKNERDMEDESRRDEVAEALGLSCNVSWEDVIERAQKLKTLADRTFPTEQSTRYQLANELITELALNVAADSTWETALHHAKFHMGALAEGIERQRSDLQANVDPDEENVDYSFETLLDFVRTNRLLMGKIYKALDVLNPHLVVPSITKLTQDSEQLEAWKNMMSEALAPHRDSKLPISRDQAVKAIAELRTESYNASSYNWRQDINDALGAMPGDINKDLKECVEIIRTMLQENKAYETKVREAVKYLQLPVTR